MFIVSNLQENGARGLLWKIILTALIAASAATALSYASDLNINGFLSDGASKLSKDKVIIDDFNNNGNFKKNTYQLVNQQAG